MLDGSTQEMADRCILVHQGLVGGIQLKFLIGREVLTLFKALEEDRGPFLRLHGNEITVPIQRGFHEPLKFAQL